jgi:hypothetical protein
MNPEPKGGSRNRVIGALLLLISLALFFSAAMR